MQNNPMQQVRVLWAGLMGSVTMFGVICFILPQQHGAAPPVMLIGIGVSAVFEAVFSFVLPAQGLKTGFRQLELETVERPAAADESSMFGGAPRMEKVIKHPGKAFKAGLMRYQTALILGAALSEAVAINGLVLHQLGFEPKEFLPFIAAGFVLIAIRYPREERIIALVEGATRARFPMG